MNATDGGRRRIRAAIGDLSEYGKRYKGKSISRKQLEQDSDLDDEEDLEDDEEEEEEVESDIEEEGDDEIEEDEEEDEDEEENDEIGDEEGDSKPRAQIKKSSDKDLNVMNFNRAEEMEKGKAVKNQLSNLKYLIQS